MPYLVAMAEQLRRVLSIQSHVVSGYVGNKSASFPLQVLGFEIDAVNSVQFSNHTGYGYWKGQVLNDTELTDLVEGLQHNKLDTYSHLLTGYIGSASFLSSVVGVVQRLRQVNPGLIYVCDPVLGDNGCMYVPKELLPIYRDRIIPMANIITPNQFEAELLTGEKIKNVEDARRCVNLLHAKGCETVVLSSTDLGSSDHLLALASSVVGKKMFATIRIPRFPHNFTGTGDLFASLLLAWMSITESDLKVSLEKTIATMQSVLKKTLEYGRSQTPEGSEISKAHLELRLIQSKREIEDPKPTIEAEVNE
ncbi:pyridoxal kinase [Ischnura elegans]|uniref:pyridoxal kinase n=1 Tax=Ischnura elegans TaxID=197161 RepID=UPI001ED875DE|nr:pyridoxal kinase [Ischnura elegans]